MKQPTRSLIAATTAVLGIAACNASGIVSTRDPHCTYPGDTIALAKVFKGDSVSACEYTIADSVRCYSSVVTLVRPSPCHVGDRERRS